jgi:hypothetical protein
MVPPHNRPATNAVSWRYFAQMPGSLQARLTMDRKWQRSRSTIRLARIVPAISRAEKSPLFYAASAWGEAGSPPGGRP